MRKGDYCITNIQKLVDEGCISPERAKELEKWDELRGEYPEISGLSEGACKPLIRETDPEVQAKGLETLGKQCSHGNIATAKQVKTILSNIRERIPTKGGDHQGAKKSNDLSGIYRPPVQPTISEVLPEEAVVIDEDVVIEEDIVDEEEDIVVEEEDVVDEGDDVVNEENVLVMSGDEGVDSDSIPTMPEMVSQGKTLVVVEEEDKDEEIEEEVKKNPAEVEAEAQERLERLKELEVQRADEEAEKIVVTCLKSILRRGYPGHKLNRLVLRAVSDVLIPDSGCPMPDSGSVTKGGAITTNLGGR